MRSVALDRRRGYYIALFLVFIVNPFCGGILALFSLRSQNGIDNKRVVYFFLALLMGMIAYTQYTTVGDLSRIYANIVEDSRGFRTNFFSAFQSKHILFDLINDIIYYFTSNVRLTTLLWVFILYYFTFLSVDNLAQFKNKILNGKEIFLLLAATIFSFIMFTQVTEIMKQGIATSIFLYSYSLFLLKKKWQSILWLFCAVNIHFSVLFFIPLFFTAFFSEKYIYCIFVFSFFMRQFDLMGTLTEYLQQFSGIGDVFLLGSIAMQVDEFHYDMEGFFRSGSFFFQFIYWHVFLVIILLKILKRDGILINATLLMLCVLNFNYYSDHNYTRLLTMMFPFYIMLSFEIMELKRRDWKTLIFSFLIIGTFLVNFRMSISRLFDSSYYNTYMDGSFLNLLVYPSIMYFL